MEGAETLCRASDLKQCMTNRHTWWCYSAIPQPPASPPESATSKKLYSRTQESCKNFGIRCTGISKDKDIGISKDKDIPDVAV